MNREDLIKEFKEIDEGYKNSFSKVDDINGISNNMKDLWGSAQMNDFARKMQDFTEDMVRLQDVFKEYEKEVSGINKVSEKLDDVYGKHR